MDELSVVDSSSLERFLNRWYGIARPRSEAKAGDTPKPLARWFELVGPSVERVNQYYKVRARDELAVTDGLLVFADDPAGEFVWACDMDDSDPLTFERMPGELQWRQTGFQLSSLLLYIAVAGGVMAAEIGLQNLDISAEGFARAASRLHKLQNPLWSWPDPNLCYYVGDDLLAYGGHEGHRPYWRLLVGARSEAALEMLSDIEWEWDSRIDPPRHSL